MKSIYIILVSFFLIILIIFLTNKDSFINKPCSNNLSDIEYLKQALRP